MIIKRDLMRQIEDSLFKDKVILIYGTRRTGKTTILKELVKKYQSQGKNCLMWNCDLLHTQQLLETINLEDLELQTKNCDILFIDEAQRIPNIGHSLKIIHDELPYLQVVATGSSSFDLANKAGGTFGRTKLNI